MTNTAAINPLYHIGVVPMLRDYLAGMSFRKIFSLHGVCTTTARQILVAAGIVVRPNDGTVYEETRIDRIKEAVERYKGGMGMISIRSRYGISIPVFRRYLESRGIPVRCAQIQRYPHLNSGMRAAVAADFGKGMCMTAIAKLRSLKLSSVKTLLRHAGIRRRGRAETVERTQRNTIGTKNIPGWMISQWKGSAKTHGHDWSITPEYLQSVFDAQSGRCYYTGIEMAVPRKRDERPVSGRRIFPLKMSPDRINSGLGYVPGNVVLCSTFANYAKSDIPHDEFIGLLKAAGEYQRLIR